MQTATATAQKQQLMQLLYEVGELLAKCAIDGASIGEGCDGSFEILDALHELEEKCDYYVD